MLQIGHLDLRDGVSIGATLARLVAGGWLADHWLSTSSDGSLVAYEAKNNVPRLEQRSPED